MKATTNEDRTLPEGWVWTKIGAIADTTSGGTPSRKQKSYYANGTIPWLKSGELEDTVINEVEEFITEAGLANSSAKIFPSGTPLVALYGATVGKTGILGIDAATNQAVCAILPRDSLLDTKFLIYWLRYSRQNLIDQSAGGAQRNISQTIVRAFPIPLAPLAEQRRIVEAIEAHLTRLEAGVQALERTQRALERYKASVLKAACEGRLVPQDPSDEPADQLLERILAERRAQWEEEAWQKEIERAQKKAEQARRKSAGLPHYIRDMEPEDWLRVPEEEYAPYLLKNDKWKRKYNEPQAPDTSELSELPEGWVWATWEQLSPRVTVGFVGKMSDQYQDSGVPFLRGQNVKENRFESKGLQYISPEFHAMIESVSEIIQGEMG